MDNDRESVALLCMKFDGGTLPLRGQFHMLDSRRYRKVYIYLKQDPEISVPVEMNGWKTYCISRFSAFKGFNLFAVWKLATVLKREKIDILHCQRHQATIYGAFAAGLAGTKVVLAHVHGLNRSIKYRRRLINVFAFRWVSRIIAVSESAREDVIKCNHFLKPEKVICLDNSIDYYRFADEKISCQEAKANIGLPQNSFVFGTVGRLVPTKGYGYLIEAFAKVHKQIPESRLVIAGTGRVKEELDAQIEKLGLANSVHLLGYRDDVEQIFRAMDVFVMSSIAEGMPGAIMEAMAASVPCISTSVGGVPDLLEQGGLGMLVPPKDSDALAEAMLSIAKSPPSNLAEMIATARSKTLEKYDCKSVAERLDRIYRKEYELATQFRC